MRIRPKWIFIVAVLIFILATAENSFADAANLKIGLATNVKILTISSVKTITAVDARGQVLRISRQFTIRSSGTPNAAYVGKRLLALPLTLSGKAPLKFNGRGYLGSFKVISRGKGLILINLIDLENYLRGVLKMEVNPKWPMEALKAQAIISRTYALRNKGRHGSSGFDLCDHSHCQVYRGINAHDQKVDQAIRVTRGTVLFFGNKLAVTPFHADSGGATADVRNVWGGNISYLKGVREPIGYESPYSFWQVTLLRDEIERALHRKGLYKGHVHNIKIYRKEPSGRVISLQLEGSEGKKIIKSNSFRMALGSKKIRSTMFYIKTSDTQKSGRPLSSTSSTLTVEEERRLSVLTRQGVFSSKEIIDMLTRPEKRKMYLLKVTNGNNANSDHYISGSNDIQSYRFVGKGWGHGVGLSQWGARNLAQHEWKVPKILHLYYPGTCLKKVY